MKHETDIGMCIGCGREYTFRVDADPQKCWRCRKEEREVKAHAVDSDMRAAIRERAAERRERRRRKVTP